MKEIIYNGEQGYFINLAEKTELDKMVLFYLKNNEE